MRVGSMWIAISSQGQCMAAIIWSHSHYLLLIFVTADIICLRPHQI